MTRTAAFGSWKSPIAAGAVVSADRRFDRPIVLEGDAVYWVESRPHEDGRLAIVRWSPGDGTHEVTPAPFSARSTVHEYGGGAFTAEAGTVFFSNGGDQRLYGQKAGAPPAPITPASAIRYADIGLDARRGRLICVAEDHGQVGREAVNSLAAVGLDGRGEIRDLVAGNDFYSSPRLSPDGTHLAWLTWNHPHMPWDAAELWLGEMREDGSIGSATHVAGGRDESVCMPRFSPDGTLYFVYEETGWWNLYRWTHGRIQPVCPMAAEFGLPAWTFGTSTYGFESSDSLIAFYTHDDRATLARVDLSSLSLQRLEAPFTSMDSLQVGDGHAVFVAGSPEHSWSIVRYDLRTGRSRVLRESSDVEIEAGYLSTSRVLDFPTEEGVTSHALFYPPTNRDFRGPDGERPPLIVVSHGGPTAAACSTLSPEIQYWTSRGFAVADVNYGGSTGYGRDYRKRLNGRLGVVDVDDCLACATFLAAAGETDPERTIIRGRSAGGYTTLAALTFRDFFRAGASHYGISDLEAMVTDTHKFESRYLESLVGPYPATRDLYRERSPVNSAQRLSCPVIFFQGGEDRVVPPSQAALMVEALRENGVPVAHVLFPDEQHGFRKAENLERALEAELFFYSRVFGFTPADPIVPVHIDNLA